MIPQPDIQQLKDGTVIFWYSYHHLKAAQTQREIDKMRNDGYKASNVPGPVPYHPLNVSTLPQS